jgi:DnaD/phage-associated family protein
MYKINSSVFKSIFAVPSEIVDKHIVTASSVSIKVLLLILRNGDASITVDEMAEKLNISKADVCDAANYWVSFGVLNKEEPKEKHSNVIRVSDTPARIVGKELEETVSSSNDFRFMLNEAERILEKHLIPSEAGVLISLNKIAGISVDVILMVITYCASIGKKSVRTVERIALDWFDKGYDNHEKVERYIQKLTENNQNENTVRTMFGIYDRSLTPKEKMLIETWFNEYKFNSQMIRIAYEKAVDNTGKLSFPYINSILKAWHENNVQTPDQIPQNDTKFENKKEKKTKTSYNIENQDELYDI